MLARNVLVVMLALLSTPLAFPAEPVAAFPPDEPTECVMDPAQPPPGGRQCDPWVDSGGDDMFGPLNLQEYAVLFRGVPLRGVEGPAGSTLLAFGEGTVCLTSGNCHFGNLNATQPLFLNTTVVVGDELLVGKNSATDDDFVYFDDGESESFAWQEADDQFALSNDLVIGSGSGASPSSMGFGGSGGGSLVYDPGTGRFAFSHPVDGTLSALDCASGELPKWTGAAWACAADLDTTYGAGNGLALAGTTFALMPCSNTQILKSASGTWVCASDLDTLTQLACATDEVPKWNGFAWACGIDEDQDTTYSAGTGLVLTGTTFRMMGCTSGQILRADAFGGWTCASDTGGDITAVTAGSGLEGGGSAGAVTLSIPAMGVTASHLAPDSVGTEEIQVNGVGAAEIEDGSVGSTELQDGSVVAAKLSTGAVTSSKILDGTILLADLAQNGCTANQILRWSGTAWVCTSQSSAANADTLDGFDSSQFLRSDVSTTYTGSLLTVSTDARVNGGLGVHEAPVSTWPVAATQATFIDGGGAVRATGPDAKAFLGVEGSDNFDGNANADWVNQDIGVLGMSTGSSAGANYGVVGYGTNAGVAALYSGNPTVDYAYLGQSGTGLIASGSSRAAEFRAPIAVTGASAVDDDVVYFDTGTSEYVKWNDADARFEVSDDVYVPATIGANEAPSSSWPFVVSQPSFINGGGALRATGPDAKGFLGVEGSLNFDGQANADWTDYDLGVLGMSVGTSAGANYGLFGYSSGAGVRGEYSGNPTVDYAELGRQNVGLVAKGATYAAQFLNAVSVEGVSSVDDDYVYFDDGSSEYIRWDDNAARFQITDELYVGGVGSSETPTTSWNLASTTVSGSTDGTGAVRGTGFDAKGWLGVEASDNFDGEALADWPDQDIGIVGMSTGTTAGANYGVVGYASGAGVRGMYSGNPTVDYAELGASTIGLKASGSSRAAQFLAPVSVQGASGVDDDYVYFDDGSTEWIRWNDATGRFEISDDVDISGTMSATTKSFVEPHPTDPTKQIWYGSLEGPEAAIYWRGSGQLVDGVARIEFPEEFRLVLSEEVPVTAYVTLTDDANGLFVKEKGTDHVVVKETGGGTSDATFDFVIYGVRAGYEDFQVIRDAAPGP